MLQLQHISKSYVTADFTQVALDDVSVTFRDNEFVCVLGPSGSGKTTMLNILGGLDHADSGDIIINGVSTKDYRSKDWDTYRNHRVGFIFQSYNLIPHQTILANVELALTLSGVSRSERRRRATEALEAVGLGEHLNKRPSQLSGGQMQRVAIARALVNDPDIVLADEPTGALDTDTGIQVMDILQSVAADRLVVMVTHNPELADEYATRIVRVRDGHVVGDTNPLTPEELGQAEAEASGNPPAAEHDDTKNHASMGFLTALSLSFNNLMTKKGRTFLTAFAGSIGIIGIAAILALSNGVNNYIAKTEQDTLSSYPLQITQSSADMGQLMGAMQSMAEDDGSSKKASADGDEIPETTVVSDMFANIHTNDLGSFKSYLESDDGADIRSHLSTVSYKYGLQPKFYSSDTDNGVTEIGSPLGTNEQGSTGAAMASLTGSSSSSSAFQEMIDDQDLVESQYDLVKGRWPSKADEGVLVLLPDGSITDYMLYSLGILDPKQLQDMVSSVSTSDAKPDVPDTHVDITYDDALKWDFKVVSPSALYRKNADTGTWTSAADDAGYMKDLLANHAHDLKIVGVIRANDQTSTGSLTPGVAYTHALTEELIADAANSQIVKDQQANPDVDVFTGKTFEELQKGSAQAFDMSSLFTIDQNALKKAFSFDSSALTAALSSGGGFDASSLGGLVPGGTSGSALGDLAGAFDPSSLKLDTSQLASAFSADTMAKIIAGAPRPDFTAAGEGIDDETREKINSATTDLVTDFVSYALRQQIDFTSDDAASQLQKLWDGYKDTDGGKQRVQAVEDAGQDLWSVSVEPLLESYVKDQLTPYLAGQFQTLFTQAAKTMAGQLSAQIQKQVSAATGSLMSQYSKAISSQLQKQMRSLSSSLQNSFSVDPAAFANAIHFNLTQDDLISLMQSYANASQLTYDNNLQTLGYADLDHPKEIDLYPISFDDKQAVEDGIDAYNDKMSSEGQDDKQIGYSDLMGTLMTSVTDIVNMVSTVLIAFVSISLVVSSIMIAIITYISVLERKKEIGILRAMGASKLNVASIFNAETIIEGLLSGVLAIVVVYIVSVPVNAWVLSWRHVENIMSLEPQAALILIAISVALTLVAGLIPSSMAARRDPVEALRSE